jgi:nucleotide-binding universal stress UspA family protein
MEASTMFKRILLPTDGSELSLRAVDTGIGLAARLGASVYAFHVIAPFPASVYFTEFVVANEPSYTREAIANAEKYLAEVGQRARAAGVPCEGSYETDARPYSAIVGAARKQQCDLFVMASHGWRGFDRLLLGSETHKVILNGDVPVLVCR